MQKKGGGEEGGGEERGKRGFNACAQGTVPRRPRSALLEMGGGSENNLSLLKQKEKAPRREISKDYTSNGEPIKCGTLFMPNSQNSQASNGCHRRMSMMQQWRIYPTVEGASALQPSTKNLCFQADVCRLQLETHWTRTICD